MILGGHMILRGSGDTEGVCGTEGVGGSCDTEWGM